MIDLALKILGDRSLLFKHLDRSSRVIGKMRSSPLLVFSAIVHVVFLEGVATTDELFAAGATFTLMPWALAYACAACEATLSGSFSAPTNPAGPRTWMEPALSQRRCALERGADRHPGQIASVLWT